MNMRKKCDLGFDEPDLWVLKASIASFEFLNAFSLCDLWTLWFTFILEKVLDMALWVPSSSF